MITIIDYGMGNIASVANMIRHAGGASTITGDPAAVAAADKLILPGVGHFEAGMAALRKTGLDEGVQQAVRNGATLLGICLGMQLLLRGSEEGSTPGLSLVAGQAHRFRADAGLRVPHMGWSVTRPVRASRLFELNGEEQRFYFVHSYYAKCDEERDVAAVTDYGQPFVSAYEHENVMGVQFHPEKSHRFGLALFRRFLSC
jgi:glutamine amidotransferase